MKRLILAILLFPALAIGAHPHLEKEYQAAWCNAAGGVMEYRLAGGPRVDCLTTTHAIEFDFAVKWAEAIGQALFYGIKTGRAPGIVLIIDVPAKGRRYYDRLRTVADKHGIMVWTMGAEDLK